MSFKTLLAVAAAAAITAGFTLPRHDDIAPGQIAMTPIGE